MTIVVGPDTFTVAADIGLALYPSGSPTYAYNQGSGTQLTVNAANDRVQATVTATDLIARCTHATAPTGDQEVTATVYGHATLDNTGGLGVRMDPAGTVNGYICTWSSGTVTIYRLDTGTFVSVAGVTRPFTTGAQTGRFKVTGSATVNLEVQIGATAIVTAADSTANRKTTGVAGMHLYNDTAATALIDDFQVDDLVAGVTRPRTTLLCVAQAVRRAALY